MSAGRDRVGGGEAVIISRESPFAPGIADLIAAADAFADALYPPESNHGADLLALAQPNVRFFVGRRAGDAVACGAIVGADGYAEIKRVFVSAPARGLGLGRRLMAVLEQAAREAGFDTLRLETGIYNHAALRLYEAHGFVRRGPFGSYGEDPLSVFMERDLA